MDIKDFFSIYKNAAWSKDATSMKNLYDKNVVIFDMWDKGYISNPLEWDYIIEDWLGNLGEENVKVEFEKVQIFQSENVGFATGLIVFQAISKEGMVLRAMKNRITLGFSKFDDGWKVVHQHTSAPINSDGLTAIFDI